eukprot:2253541-Rhodomonas_salina.3
MPDGVRDQRDADVAAERSVQDVSRPGHDHARRPFGLALPPVLRSMLALSPSHAHTHPAQQSDETSHPARQADETTDMGRAG